MWVCFSSLNPGTDEHNISNYLSENPWACCDQNILLGTTFRIMANTLSGEPDCLADIEESKARRILELSGSSSGDVEPVMSAGRVAAAHLRACCECLMLQAPGLLESNEVSLLAPKMQLHTARLLIWICDRFHMFPVCLKDTFFCKCEE